MIETKTPGICAQHARISPVCRVNRGNEGAIDEALRRIKEQYLQLLLPANVAANFHVVLTVERPEPKLCECGHPESGHTKVGAEDGPCLAVDKLGFACCRCETFVGRESSDSRQEEK